MSGQLDLLRELHPLVRAEAATAEADRRLTGPVLRALVDAGATRMLAPARHGGAELDLPTWVRALEELAHADGSAGWTAMTTSATSSIAWFLPEDAAREVFGDPSSVAAGTAAPLGRTVAADDGHRVTGRWGWGSATPYSQWIVGGAMVEGRPRIMVFDARDVTIHDTWHATGLRATASHDFEVADVLVPLRRQAWPPRSTPTLAGPIPSFPYFGYLAIGVAAVTLGIASRAVEEIEALAVAKTPQYSGVRLAEQTGAQLDLATAEARLSAARAFLHDELRQCWQDALGGRQVGAGRRARLRLACSYAAGESAEVTRLAFTTGGGSSVFETSVLQRCLRDAHVAGQHAMVSRRLFETYAKVKLDIPADTNTL